MPLQAPTKLARQIARYGSVSDQGVLMIEYQRPMHGIHIEEQRRQNGHLSDVTSVNHYIKRVRQRTYIGTTYEGT